MNADAAQQVLGWLAGNFNARLDENQTRVWLEGLAEMDTGQAMGIAVRYCQDSEYFPRFVDFNRLYYERSTPRPNAPMRRSDCVTCDGDRLVLVSRRGSYEEMAPCPDCNSGCHAEFHSVIEGRMINPPDPSRVRALISA